MSSNDSGFIKERSIIENVFVTHELVTCIEKREKLSNMVFKLDMTKAITWFLCFS